MWTSWPSMLDVVAASKDGIALYESGDWKGEKKAEFALAVFNVAGGGVGMSLGEVSLMAADGDCPPREGDCPLCPEDCESLERFARILQEDDCQKAVCEAVCGSGEGESLDPTLIISIIGVALKILQWIRRKNG